MNNELISIIIPVYNLDNYISKTVTSVINQTYKNIEIIIVNDGSTDNSLCVINNLKNQYPKIIKVINKENGGVTKARLSGVEHASGEWIGFVDGDDIVEPEMYELLLNNATMQNADISHCGYKMVFPDKEVLLYGTEKTVIQSNEDGIRDLLIGTFIEPGLCNKLYKKELFTSILHGNTLDSSIKNNEDVLMNYYLFRQSKLSVYEDKCLYNYIVRENSASKSKVNINILMDPIKVNNIILNAEQNSELYHVALTRYVRSVMRVATMSTKEDIELINPQQKKCRKILRYTLSDALHYANGGISLKLQLLFATFMPDIYKAIHEIYLKR